MGNGPKIPVMRYVLLVLWLLLTPVQAETLTIITWAVGQQPYANTLLVGKYMQKYLPNIDKVVIKVVPGAGSLNAANYPYRVANKDGYTIGTFTKSIPLRTMLDVDKNINIDISKFIWLGSTTDGRKESVVLVSHKPLNELVIVGEQNSSDLSIVDIIKSSTNLQMKKIAGYNNISELRLAFQRKEIDAFFNNYTGLKEYDINLKSKVILQYGNGIARHEEMLSIPTLIEFSNDTDATNALELSSVFSKPFVAPPNIPKEKAAQLRAAFAKVVSDPNYISEANLISLEIIPVLWEESEIILNQLSGLKSSLLKFHAINE